MYKILKSFRIIQWYDGSIGCH